MIQKEKDTYKAISRRKHCYTTHESEHFDTDETNGKCVTDHQPMKYKRKT